MFWQITSLALAILCLYLEYHNGEEIARKDREYTILANKYTYSLYLNEVCEYEVAHLNGEIQVLNWQNEK